MTPEELVDRLAGVRIPESFARFGVQDALAACAIGLMAGLLIAALLTRVTVRRSRPVDEARRAISDLALRERQLRLTGLAALLHANGGAAPEGLRDALYDPRARLDPATLETAVLAAARRRPRR